MTYEFPTRYKSVVFCVAFGISRFALLFVYPLITSLFVLPLFTASDHYHCLRRSDRHMFPIRLKVIYNMYERKAWRYIRGDALYAEFIHRSFSRDIKTNLTRSFNLRFLYLDDSYQYICFMMLSIASISLEKLLCMNSAYNAQRKWWTGKKRWLERNAIDGG
jgi:hypothetical protein